MNNINPLPKNTKGVVVSVSQKQFCLLMKESVLPPSADFGLTAVAEGSTVSGSFDASGATAVGLRLSEVTTTTTTNPFPNDNSQDTSVVFHYQCRHEQDNDVVLRLCRALFSLKDTIVLVVVVGAGEEGPVPLASMAVDELLDVQGVVRDPIVRSIVRPSFLWNSGDADKNVGQDKTIPSKKGDVVHLVPFAIHHERLYRSGDVGASEWGSTAELNVADFLSGFLRRGTMQTVRLQDLFDDMAFKMGFLPKYG
eukprot:PhM_4_TR17710/c0_g1_i1/m.61731